MNYSKNRLEEGPEPEDYDYMIFAYQPKTRTVRYIYTFAQGKVQKPPTTFSWTGNNVNGFFVSAQKSHMYSNLYSYVFCVLTNYKVYVILITSNTNKGRMTYMQYETIILELMTRIKQLEDEVSLLKDRLDAFEGCAESDKLPSSLPAVEPGSTRGKTTPAMMDACYVYGKQAFQTKNFNYWVYADSVTSETGMNRTSAFMYVYAVNAMLRGVVFKRIISNPALKRYLSKIHEEFGDNGLELALQSVTAHAQYRREQGITYDSILDICNEYRQKLA